MRVRFIAGTVLALGLGLGLTLPIYSEEPKSSPPPPEEKLSPEMVALGKLAGDWDVVIKEQHEPGAPLTETKGSATFKVILDGHFLQQDFKGSMMGMKYSGHGIEGYDAGRKKYTSVWVDSLNQVPMLMDGESTDGGKTITYIWEVPAEGGGGKMKLVHTEKSADEFRFEVKMAGETDITVVDMTYTRRKK